MSPDPITFFTQWLDEAKADTRIAEPTAMCLSTATLDGAPSSRMVLLKAHGENAFTFFTNLESRKSRELKQNPQGALCFHWMPLERQVRIEGGVTQVSDAEADAYFATRPRDSQIGAWASIQSQKLDNRQTFLDRIAQTKARFEGADVPRPPHWSGWQVMPQRMEFWQQIEFRLHERQLFTRSGNIWSKTLLYP